MLKKIFIFLSIICLGVNFEIFGIDKNQDNIYQMRTKEDLYEFARIVNSGKSNASAVLMNDIVINKNIKLSDKEIESEKKYLDWEPIGKNSNNKKEYTGVFNGNNHSISGIYCDTENNSGLFGCLGTGGEIKNLKIKKSYFLSNLENNFDSDEIISCGAVCALSFGRIKNCKSENNIIISKASDENACKSSGGICGRNSGEIIESETRNTTIKTEGKGENNSGGICGLELETGRINKCMVNKNTKVISEGNYKNCSGGVVGQNLGTVYKSKVNNTKVIAQGSGARNKSGGICGKNMNILDTCTVSSEELVSEDGQAGSVCAYSAGKQINCKYDDDFMLKILISIRNSIRQKN